MSIEELESYLDELGIFEALITGAKLRRNRHAQLMNVLNNRSYSMKYPMFKVHMPVNDALKGIEHVLQSGFINEGLQVKEFETSLSDYLGVKNLILVPCLQAHSPWPMFWPMWVRTQV